MSEYDLYDYDEYLVGADATGPGASFFSSGPHGESSLTAQNKAAHTDDHADQALEGALGMAADQVVENMGDDQGQFQGFEEVGPSGGGGGGPIPNVSSGPIPGGSEPLASTSAKISLPLLLGVGAGLLFFLVKK